MMHVDVKLGMFRKGVCPSPTYEVFTHSGCYSEGQVGHHAVEGGTWEGLDGDWSLTARPLSGLPASRVSFVVMS